MKEMIPLCVPSLRGNEWEYVKECIDTEWVSSAGKYVDLFEKNISEYTGSKYAIACVNGTSALQVSLRLAGVQSEDEVIAPTLTFIAPINSIRYLGAHPVFMDSDKYYNINHEKTIQFIDQETVFKDGFSYNRLTNKRVSAIIPVHVWGNACWLDELYDLCKQRNIKIIEDASESLGTFYTEGKFSGKHTGTVGDFGCISFNGNKIITTGGGGMILTNSQDLAEKAKYLTTQAKDDPIKYIHNEIGYNFRLTNIQSALGVAQLEQLPKFLIRKKEIFNKYNELVNIIDGLSISKVPNYSNNNYWINLLHIDESIFRNDRDNVMNIFDKNSVQTRPVWKLNHLQKPYIDCQCYSIKRAMKLVESSLCIPSSSNLTDSNINQILEILHD